MGLRYGCSAGRRWGHCWPFIVFRKVEGLGMMVSWVWGLGFKGLGFRVSVGV